MTKHLYEHPSIRSRFTSNVIEVMLQKFQDDQTFNEHCSIRSRFTSNVIEVMMQYACICRHIMGFIPFSPLNINFSMSKLEKVQNPIK
jgi:hypothetical protein